MIVGGSGQTPSLTLPKSNEIQPKDAAASGNPVPHTDTSETVSISEKGKFQLQKEMDDIKKARENGEFIDTRDREGKVRLGLMALGKSSVDEWAAKGLNLSESAVMGAAEAFQQGFRQSVENYGSSMAGSSVALNKHKIIMNSQSVPDWFVQEYEQNLSSIGNQDVRNAFKSGDTFFASPPSTSKSEALNRYAAVASTP